MHGLDGGDSFDAMNIDLPSLFSNSLERYFVMGTDSYSSRNLFENGQIVDPAKMAHLSVALSKVRTVDPGNPRNFPFSCGDWTSNCTSAFMERVNVDVKDEQQMRGSILFRVSGSPVV